MNIRGFEKPIIKWIGLHLFFTSLYLTAMIAIVLGVAWGIPAIYGVLAGI